MTARYADRVAMMSADGRMAETGDPRELMSDEGSRLWALINKVGGWAHLVFLGGRKFVARRPAGLAPIVML